MHTIFKDFIQRQSLTAKLLWLTILAGLFVFTCTYIVFTDKADKAFRNQLQQQLEAQAMEGQLRFDNYVKAHYQLAKLIANQYRFADYVHRLSMAAESPKHLERQPDWLPNRSVLRTFTHALYYLLLDADGKVLEVFNSDGPPPPNTLLKPDKHIITASRNENFMTSIDHTPYIISSASFRQGNDKKPLATVMLATPIDDELLLLLTPTSTTHQIVALTTGFDPYIIASSHPADIALNTKLKDIEQKYLVIGQTVYNYEYSDLLVTYNHLMPLEKIRELATPIIVQERIQLLSVTAILITIFILLVARINNRIRDQTRKIIHFSEEALGARHTQPPRGDELTVLEDRFKLLAAEVLKASRNSENFLQTVIEAMPAPIFFKDIRGVYLGCNRAFENFVGQPRNKIVGQTLHDLAPKEMADLSLSRDEQLLDGGGRQIYEARIRDAEGNEHDVIFHKAVFKGADESVDGIVGIMVDITDLKTAERKVGNALSLLRSLIDSIPDLIFYKDENSVYLGCNKAFTEYAGKNEADIIGKTDRDFFSPETADFFRNKDREMLDRLKPQRNEELVNYPDGRQHLLDTLKTPYYAPDGKVLGLIGISRDITEQRHMEKDREKLQNQLRQAQKLESIGTLAGGIAHDFNNILSSILGFTELARMDQQEPEKFEDDLAEVKRAGDRARELVKQLLTFSRMTELEKTPLKMSHIVKESLKLLRPSIPASIEMATDISSNKIVLADKTQIHQIIMNLCTNSYQAMKETGGTLTISLTDEIVDESQCIQNPEAKPGPYQKLTIKDTGHGMDKGTMAKIFEPYFTTKEVGEGTGLGLSVVHGIVIQSGGFINVESEPGQGTVFNVFLPLYLPDGYTAPVGEETGIAVKKGSGRIMYVDDEPNLCILAARVLEKYGYEVAVFPDGSTAWEEYAIHPDRYDLIVTDMTMPRMSGLTLAGQVLQKTPGKPIILCTGYSDMVSRNQALDLGIADFIQKPFEMSEIARVVSTVLTRSDNGQNINS